MVQMIERVKPSRPFTMRVPIADRRRLEEAVERTGENRTAIILEALRLRLDEIEAGYNGDDSKPDAGE